uniref:Signal transduction histidine kinase n=1 Tax=Aspergillus oryzae (strain ATCC 42149 / RIB 40) TaxID=510516 RepID=UPI00017546B3|nr:Chain A, Signal transduction histidine kinase [Aspergillus oryzae RIB40]
MSLEPSQIMPLSVLIAEDNDICRLVAAKALEKCTNDITVVTNGLQALQAYQNRQFDVIIMDIQMPVMDGLEAVSEIRNYERTHNTKRASIIAITADTIDDDRPGAELDEYVSKPLNPNQLRDVVLTCHSEGAEGHHHHHH